MIKFTKPAAPLGYAYKEGNEVQLSEAVEAAIVDAGYAVYVNVKHEEIVKAEEPKKVEKATKKK